MSFRLSKHRQAKFSAQLNLNLRLNLKFNSFAYLESTNLSIDENP